MLAVVVARCGSARCDCARCFRCAPACCCEPPCVPLPCSSLLCCVFPSLLPPSLPRVSLHHCSPAAALRASQKVTGGAGSATQRDAHAGAQREQTQSAVATAMDHSNTADPTTQRATRCKLAARLPRPRRRVSLSSRAHTSHAERRQRSDDLSIITPIVLLARWSLLVALVRASQTAATASAAAALAALATSFCCQCNRPAATTRHEISPQRRGRDCAR